jgi:hypothetical protein
MKRLFVNKFSKEGLLNKTKKNYSLTSFCTTSDSIACAAGASIVCAVMGCITKHNGSSSFIVGFVFGKPT